MSHLRIFGSATYCHVLEEKRKKLDNTAKKGYLVGYSENAKAYRIYIPESRKIVVRRDVNFMEERAFRQSRKMPSATQSEEEPQVQPQRPVEGNTSASPRHGDPRDTSPEDLQEGEQMDPPTTRGRTRKELRQILRDEEEFVEAHRNENRQHRQLERYQALIVQVGEPSSFREAAQHQVWVDAMVEEYSSIMTNDVWEVVPRPQDISVVGS